MDEFKYEFLEELQEGLTPEQFAERKRKEMDEIGAADIYIQERNKHSKEHKESQMSPQMATELKERVLESMVEEYEKEYEMYLKEQSKL